MKTNNLIFVDCEANGRCPGKGVLTEFGAVHYPSRQYFHGKLIDSALPELTLSILDPTELFNIKIVQKVMKDFEEWLDETCYNERPVFVSDNPAFDWQWINYYFWHYGNGNPFGHSARRISDFYAGLTGDFYNSQKWKKLRITVHDHNPVHDAMGNLEAFDRMLKGER